MTLHLPRSLVLAIVIAAPAAGAKTPVATGTGGAVATISEQASQAALTILNRGGNAVDAAVAAAATLGVTDPFSCGIGGGGFMMIYLANEKRVVTIDHRETAPASVTPALFTQDGKPMDFDTAVTSGASVGVPGTVRGWHDALSRYGTMHFKDVLQPAIGVATRGFVVSENFHKLVAQNEARFARFSSTSALYLRDGKAVGAGTLLRNPDLAKAYRELAAHGQKAFYHGALARALVKAVNEPPVAPGQKVRPGAMTLADLAGYESHIRQPVHTSYRGYDVYGMPPPSSGGVAIGEALNILEGFDLDDVRRAQAEHLYLEATRLAFADRNAYLADPDYVDAPVEGLLSDEYAAVRRKLIDPLRSMGVAPAGDPTPFLVKPTGDASARPRPKAAQPRTESTHTTHLAVSDKHGNIVAYTFTIESWGGSGIVVPGYGFLLNNELTDFNFTAPHPNAPQAGKRPRSSMAPTIVLKDGKPAFTVGSPGGATIITTVLQTIVNHIDLHMPMDAAINAPRISNLGGAASYVEPGFPGSEQAKALEQLGQAWEGAPEEIGAANAIVFNPDGTVTAVSEAHRHGTGSALVQSAAH
ncbi:MAG: gamma-glutamyltransferase [Gammaproteobacteria bacterium]